MSKDDIYRQQKITPNDLNDPETPQGDPLAEVQNVRDQMAKEINENPPTPFKQTDVPFEMSGNVPPQLRQAIQGAKTGEKGESAPQPVRAATPDRDIQPYGSGKLAEVLEKLADQQRNDWEEFTWPSGGKFYTDIPATIHIRPMTGEEEQILATPRHVKRGKAIDMIFKQCIREQFDTEKLLSADRTHLLIFLRGISYTPEYDVEIKCPDCGMKFSDVIDLNNLNVENCNENFNKDDLEGVLPASGLEYRYRLSTGQDEMLVSQYREQKISKWGEQSEDDTLLYRTALLLEELGGVTMTKEIQMIIKKLPMQDVSYLRNEVSDPPFGVDTDISILCPNCTEEFKIDLPLETSFFFPRKKTTPQA